MRRIITEFYRNHKQLVHYGLIGMSGVLLDFFVFAILYNAFNVPPLLANVLSTSCGIINNFFLNSRFNFKRHDLLLLRFLSFYSTGLLGLTLSSVIIRVFHDYAGFDANIVKLSTIIFVVLLQYSINKAISFREYTGQARSSLQIIRRFVRLHWLEIVAIAMTTIIITAYIPSSLSGTEGADSFLQAKLILSGQLPYGDFLTHMSGAYGVSSLLYVLADGDWLSFRVVYAVMILAWLLYNFKLIHTYGSRYAASIYMLLSGIIYGPLLQHQLLAASFVAYSVSTIAIALLVVPVAKLRQKDWLIALPLLLFFSLLMAIAYF